MTASAVPTPRRVSTCGFTKSDRVNPDPVLAGTTTFTDIARSLPTKSATLSAWMVRSATLYALRSSQTIMEGLKSDWTAKMTAVQPTDVALANQHMNSEGTCTQKATQSVGDSKDPGPAPSPTPTPAPTCSGNQRSPARVMPGSSATNTGSGSAATGRTAAAFHLPLDYNVRLRSAVYVQRLAVYPGSPIIIDTKGEGFHLTDVAHGVKFALMPGQPPLPMPGPIPPSATDSSSWTVMATE